MLGALAFGLGVGAAVQAWRAFPASAPVSGDAVAVVFVAGMVIAYLAGRSRRGSSSVAVASAEANAAAVASNSVNLQVVIPGGGARPEGFTVPSEAAPWIVSHDTVPELTSDQLEGMDLSELLDVHDTQDG